MDSSAADKPDRDVIFILTKCRNRGNGSTGDEMEESRASNMRSIVAGWLDGRYNKLVMTRMCPRVATDQIVVSTDDIITGWC